MHFSIDLLSGIAVPHIIIQKDGHGGKERIDVTDGGNRSMKLIIDIPEWYYKEVKEFKHPVLIDKSIMNGVPLDDVKAEIDEQYDRVRPYNIDVAQGLEMALDILDNISKEESEEI